MSLSSNTIEQIDQAVASFMNDSDVTGFIASIQQGGATVFENGYGVTQLGGSPPTTSTSFQIDSLTKALTAIGVLHLWELGTIVNLSDTLGTYIPLLPNNDWYSIQIDQLLAMCSGIPDASSDGLTYEQVLREVATRPLQFAPGAQYDYSDPNYMLLGILIASVTNEHYGKWMIENVLAPLSMPNTGLIDVSAVTDPATPYVEGVARAWRNPFCGFAAGGFASTMSDLESFAIGLANGAILQQSTYELMWTNYTLNDGSLCRFGLGWNVTTKNGALAFAGKNGGGWGWGSQLDYAPGSDALTGGTSVCVMMTGSANDAAIAKQLLDIVLRSG